jgi:hypothetical protein
MCRHVTHQRLHTHTHTHTLSPLSAYMSSCYYICVLMPLHPCPHTSINVSSYYYICLHTTSMCPRTAMYMSSHYYICVHIPLHPCPHTTTPYTTSCYYICIRILLYICPHTTTYVQVQLASATAHTHSHTHSHAKPAILLASLNNLYKLDASVFSAWMFLLRQLPHASLVLLEGKAPARYMRPHTATSADVSS